MTPTPSRLEYAYSFDLAVAWLGRAAYPWLAVVSSPEFVDHVLSRAAGAVVFACEDTRTSRYAATRLTSGEVARHVARGSRVLPLPAEPEAAAFGGAVWAAPQRTTWVARLGLVERSLAPGGHVCILTGTGAGAFTRPLRARPNSGAPAPLDGPLVAGLAGAGWRVTRSHRLGGIASMGWAAAGRLATLAGRPDLADRADRAHHLSAENGIGASYALLLAGRGGGP